MMTVRPLTIDELDAAIPLIRNYLEASQLPIVFDPQKIRSTWRVVYELGRGEMAGLFDGHSLVGIFAVHDMDSMFGEIHGANEWVWWVEPEYRKSGAGLRLLDWAEEWAQSRGLFLTIGAYDCLAGDALSRLYHRRGYQRRGSLFTKEFAHV